MRKEELGRLVDEFGRTSDATFQLDELLGFLDERAGQQVDEEEVMKLAGSSPYLFESWDDPMVTRYVPRRRFFQGAEFLVTPSKEELAGGYLFPGHRFSPFINRDVFPADAWLVMADGSAPLVKRVDLPMAAAKKSLRFFGDVQSREYLVSDDPVNEKAGAKVSVSTYDLRDFYLATDFKPGDSILFKTLDWMQGVYSIAKSTGPELPERAAVWTSMMTAAHARMQAELGDKADCYEQLAITLLLGVEAGHGALLRDPPVSLEAFVEGLDKVELVAEGDRAVLRRTAKKSAPAASLLDAVFVRLGVTALEVETRVLEALKQGSNDPDFALALVCAGRPLLFKSPEDQEEFHRLWLELWRKVVDSGSPER